MPKSKKEIADEAFSQEVNNKRTELNKADAREIEPASGPEGSLVEVPLETIPLNVTLPCSVYLKSSGKMLVFRRQGEKVNYKTALDLHKKGSSVAYIHKAFWKLFTDSLEHMKMDVAKTKEEEAGRTRRLLLAYGQELEKQIREPKRPVFKKLRKLSDEMCDELTKDQTSAKKFLKKGDDPLTYIPNHAVNTCVYAILMGLKLQLPPSKLKDLAFAAYVHDVGNLYLPKRILYKKSELTDEDRALVQTHPRRGAVLYHHERMDGTGYPSNIRGEEIPLLARIVAIAECYDAMTSNRPYQKAISSKEALDLIAKMEGKFDTTLISFVSPAAAPVAKAG